tara:strand:- start:492 stop:716 length:225 start_codon:yes stop_codon:yes gene_type:complete
VATTEHDVLFDKLAEEAFPFLDELRESGSINMFQAPDFIIEEMGVDKHMARKLVSAWMYQFTLKKEKKKDDVDS